MSWHLSHVLVKAYENSRSLPAQGAEYSEATCSDGEQSVQSSTTLTPAAYYWPDKTTEHSRLSRFGMKSVLLAADRGEALLTWFRAGFPARTLAPQDQTTMSTEQCSELTASTADCGQSSGELLARYDRDSSTWRIPQCSLLGDSDEFLETWPRWGMTRNGVAYRAQVSVPTMYEIESGSLLPTPTCHNAKEGAWPAEYTRNTPTLATHVGGKIHPNFTEWMMGWPLDWTDLKPLGTAKFREWQQQHGGF